MEIGRAVGTLRRSGEASENGVLGRRGDVDGPVTLSRLHRFQRPCAADDVVGDCVGRAQVGGDHGKLQ